MMGQYLAPWDFVVESLGHVGWPVGMPLQRGQQKALVLPDWRSDAQTAMAAENHRSQMETVSLSRLEIVWPEPACHLEIQHLDPYLHWVHWEGMDFHDDSLQLDAPPRDFQRKGLQPMHQTLFLGYGVLKFLDQLRYCAGWLPHLDGNPILPRPHFFKADVPIDDVGSFSFVCVARQGPHGHFFVHVRFDHLFDRPSTHALSSAVGRTAFARSS
eukprot:scaffold524_cov357-Pavlova_lutheri.AAC.27